MDNHHDPVPTVMAFAENDPCGGSGIQADIEALASMGCHCAPIITAITTQDSINIKDISACSPELIANQSLAVLEDLPIHAFKIGMLANTDNIYVIYNILEKYPDIPVILNTNLKSSHYINNLDPKIAEAMMQLLIPCATVCISTIAQAKALTPHTTETEIDMYAQAIIKQGAKYVLITGTVDQNPLVTNKLYSKQKLIETFKWKRLQQPYHGSGYTLAASIAGLLAQDVDPLAAIYEAQEYTWGALKEGYCIGMGNHLPNRLFWVQDQSSNS